MADKTPNACDRRTQARELTIQALCQLDVQGNDVMPWLGQFFRQECTDAMTVQLAETWTAGAWEHIDDCDQIITGTAAQWKLARLSQVDRCILRLSVYQMKYCTDIPGKVIINEAIELAKKYSTEQSPRFVNGVLDAILRRIRPQEIAAGSKPAAPVNPVDFGIPQ